MLVNTHYVALHQLRMSDPSQPKSDVENVSFYEYATIFLTEHESIASLQTKVLLEHSRDY